MKKERQAELDHMPPPVKDQRYIDLANLALRSSGGDRLRAEQWLLRRRAEVERDYLYRLGTTKTSDRKGNVRKVTKPVGALREIKMALRLLG